MAFQALFGALWPRSEVMENLHSGRSKLRLLDIKVGQKTAQAGWQGKSRAAALKQSILDGHTNSAGEGFRLEGFDGQPHTLTSMARRPQAGSVCAGSPPGRGAKERAETRVRRYRIGSLTIIVIYINT